MVTVSNCTDDCNALKTPREGKKKKKLLASQKKNAEQSGFKEIQKVSTFILTEIQTLLKTNMSLLFHKNEFACQIEITI